MPAVPCTFCSELRDELKPMCPTCTGTGLVPASFEADRAFVISCLHWDGSRSTSCSAATKAAAYAACDGFGRLGSEQLAEIGWDWSHVRDSSPAGMAAAAAILKAELNIRYG